MNNMDIGGRLAFDVRGLASLKQAAQTDPAGAAKVAAKQFDAIFVNLLLKQMRDASPQDGPFDSAARRMYTSMLDQQLSQTIASRGIGIAEQLLKQMLRQVAQADPDVMTAAANTALSSTTATNTALPGAASVHSIDAARAVARASLSGLVTSSIADHADDDGSGMGAMLRPGLNERVQHALTMLHTQTEAGPGLSDVSRPADSAMFAAGASNERMAGFYNKLIGHARQASQETGIPAHFMIGHAALESGWGRREIRAENGANTHNLFGIKAGRSWTGPTAEITTTEYIDGVAHKIKGTFRAYRSYAEAFKDYANLLTRNPRYSNVIAAGTDAASFAWGLQRAGYATDPNYANKIMAVLKRIA